MAFVKTVCSDCGGELFNSDNFCPHCGASIDRSVQVHPPSGKCSTCGAPVDATANFCESCGTALNFVAQPPRSSSRNSTVNVASRKTPPAKKKSAKRFETWQLVTGVVVVSLVAFFAYRELDRDTGFRKPPIPATFPAQTGPSIQDIENQQAKVDANPKDRVALLKLANMLHDASLHDSRLLQRAIDAYAKYLTMDPADPNARVDMGICYFELARVDSDNAPAHLSRAIAEMKTAIQNNPNHQPAAFNLGIVNLNAGDMGEAAKWFAKAVAIDPNSDLGKRAKQLLEQHSPQDSPN